jgi:tRNA1(Val) A37 N6-methylase TrmN6
MKMEINRLWAMPNKNTFSIKPIKELIEKHKAFIGLDLFPYPYKEDVLDLLKRHKDESNEIVLFDPPYSPRQLKECYDSRGEVLHDTKSSVWSNWKDETARVIKPGGICLSFGWSSQGLGKNRGFKIIEILLVAHGGNHNDTICVVEKKVQGKLALR